MHARARIIIVSLVAGLLFTAAVFSSGCGTPGPTPPSPAPGVLVSCEAPSVVDQAPNVGGPARDCLLGTDPAACLDALATVYGPDSVACAVREEGVRANRNVLSGVATELDTVVDRQAQVWIRGRGIGYL